MFIGEVIFGSRVRDKLEREFDGRGISLGSV